jgi:hypothetical protein
VFTLIEGFPCFFLSCKANARIKLANRGHGPHYSKLVVICVVLLLFVLFHVLFVCKCVLYYCHWVATQLQLSNIISYRISYHHIISSQIKSNHIIYHIVSYHYIISRQIKSNHIIYHIVYHIISYHIISYHTAIPNTNLLHIVLFY